MYDYTMMAISGKPLVVNIKNDDGSKTEIFSAFATDKYFNWNAIEAVTMYPIIIKWLVEFMKAHISKKFPAPTTK
jgi:hypothetical protein